MIVIFPYFDILNRYMIIKYEISNLELFNQYMCDMQDVGNCFHLTVIMFMSLCVRMLGIDQGKNHELKGK